jgi:hypothetical protein
MTLAAGAGGGEIDSYATGDAVELRARGVSEAGVSGPYTTTVALTVGSVDADIPVALDENAITVTPLLGGVLIQVATGDDSATTALQVYRSLSPVLDRETDATGALIAVEPQASYSTALGDTGRETLIAGGAMNSAASWTLGAGWAIASGVASHTTGASGSLQQAFNATAGKYYRIGFTLAGTTAGSMTPRLTGGSDRSGTSISADGQYSDRIQAVTGNDTIECVATSDFNGSLDDITAYLETAACLAQGRHYIWIEPQNVDGLPGPLAGPFEINIV